MSDENFVDILLNLGEGRDKMCQNKIVLSNDFSVSEEDQQPKIFILEDGRLEKQLCSETVFKLSKTKHN